jgi:hypothetical protein
MGIYGCFANVRMSKCAGVQMINSNNRSNKHMGIYGCF